MGTAITATTAAYTNPRPRNRSRASAYPASDTKKTRPSVTVTVTIAEFANQSGKSLRANRRS